MTPCDKQGVDQADLTIHADRGTAATSKTVADLLDTLGVRLSFSRPRVRRASDDRITGLDPARALLAGEGPG